MDSITFTPFENKIWLSSPTMHGEELKYMKEAYETNWMSTVGANINEVERLTAEKVGCKYAVALSCGTAALHLAMKIAGIKQGDYVFCSDCTLDATGKPIVNMNKTEAKTALQFVKYQQKNSRFCLFNLENPGVQTEIGLTVAFFSHMPRVNRL